MSNIEKIEAKLKTYNKKEMSTKELNLLGINQYYIKLLLENGSLEKVSRGKYKVTLKRSYTSHDEYLLQKNFEAAVFKGEIEKAYYLLKLKSEKRLNNNYNYQMRNYFVIIEAILGNKFDYNYQDELEVVDRDISNYGIYFIECINCVLEKRYEEAFKNIERFKLEEQVFRGELTTNTMVISKLIEILMKKRVIINSYVQSKKASESFYNLENNLKNGEYINAYINACENLLYSDFSHQSNSKIIVELLNKTIMLLRGNILEEKNIGYSQYKSDIAIFNASLKNEDYLTSYKYIGKITYQNPSRILEMMKKILHKMIEINKENIKSKKDNKVIEVKEEVKITLNDEIIEDMVINGEYKELKQLILEKKKSGTYLTRIESYVLKLLRGLKHVTNEGYEKVEHFYESPESDYFHLFFEAINVRDFKKANEVGKIIIEKAKNPDEFNIYMTLLNDIDNSNQKYEERMDVLNNISEINEILKDIITKEELSYDDINLIWDLIYQKYELIRIINGKSYIEENILYILDTINSIESGLIKEGDFENFSNDSKSLTDNFMNCLNNGDYISANNLLSSNHFNLFKPIFKSHDLRLMRLLFKYMIDLMNKPNDKKLENNKLVSEQDLIVKLDELVRLFKNKKDPNGALNYYLNNSFDGISDELNRDIAAYLAYLSSVQKNQADELYGKFKEAKIKEDVELIKDALKDYKEFIVNTSLDRDLTHHYKRIEIDLRDKQTDNYQEKEELYQKALDLFKGKDYKSSLGLINKYLSLDHDINSKGYILKAKIMEKMNYYDEAKKIYLACLNISKEPTIYYRLACIYQYEGNFEEAIKYMLLYENIRPDKNPNSSRVLSVLYQAINNEEKSEEYNKKYKRLKYLYELEKKDC